MIAEVSLDIKPGACPNRLNSKSGGFLGVAIAGTPTGEFYAAEIDPAAVRLGGVAPYLYSIKDVTSPYEPLIGKEGCDDCARSRSDGIADFQMRFDPDAIRSAIGPVTADTCVVLHLSGNFTDGFPFVGEDVLLLRVVGKPTVKNAPASGSSTISAWPNPVSEVTVVRFALAEPAMVRVTVHDMLGREVAVIAEGRYGAGPHTAQWDGTTGGGHPVGPGLYFVSIETGGHTSTSKIVVLE
jgi:hypothetical protein